MVFPILHDPIRRWGWPTTVRNYYFGSPYECGCNNGWMNTMMKWQFGMSMMNSISNMFTNAISMWKGQPSQPSQYQTASTFYPYVNFSGQNNGLYNPQNMFQHTQNDWYGLGSEENFKKQLALKNLGDTYKDYNVMEMEGKYVALKGEKMLEADSPLELARLISKDVGSSKAEKENDNTKQDAVAQGAGEADGAGGVDGGKKADPDAAAPVDGGDAAAGAGNAAGAGDAAKPKNKGIKLPLGWYNASADSSEIKNTLIENKGNNRNRGTLAVKYVAEVVLNAKVENPDDYDIDKLKEDLIQYNPSIFDKNGNYKTSVDFNKLDIPNYDYIKKHYLCENNGTAKQENKVTKYGTRFTKPQRICGTKYNQGIKFTDKNAIVSEGKYGNWEWDRDAILYIDGTPYTLYKFRSMRRDGSYISGADAIDFGELVGTSTYWNRENPILEKTTNGWKFKGSDWSEEYTLKGDKNSKYGNEKAKICTFKGVPVLLHNGKRYDLNQLMMGKKVEIDNEGKPIAK